MFIAISPTSLLRYSALSSPQKEISYPLSIPVASKGICCSTSYPYRWIFHALELLSLSLLSVRFPLLIAWIRTAFLFPAQAEFCGLHKPWLIYPFLSGCTLGFLQLMNHYGQSCSWHSFARLFVDTFILFYFVTKHLFIQASGRVSSAFSEEHGSELAHLFIHHQIFINYQLDTALTILCIRVPKILLFPLRISQFSRNIYFRPEQIHSTICQQLCVHVRLCFLLKTATDTW